MVGDFLEELRAQHQREFDVKNALDNKANNTITMASTTGTLLMGFGVFLLSKINPQYEFFGYAMLALIGGIVAIITSIGLSMLAYRLRDYRQIIIYRKFLSKDQSSKEKFDWNFVDNLIEEEKSDKFERRVVKDYLLSIRKNFKENESKANWISGSQVAFIVGVGTIPFFVYLLIDAVNKGMILANGLP